MDKFAVNVWIGEENFMQLTTQFIAVLYWKLTMFWSYVDSTQLE